MKGNQNIEWAVFSLCCAMNNYRTKEFLNFCKITSCSLCPCFIIAQEIKKNRSLALSDVIIPLPLGIFNILMCEEEEEEELSV